MSEERDIIFISHATPDDNDFSIWLASRLQLLGYEVWIDRNALIGGEKFWQDIDQIIRNKAVKFLLVYSENICQRDSNNSIIPGQLKDGVYKEFSLAESIGKQHSLSDFIVLLNIDGATYNLFIGADRLNQIPFYENWATGFNQLVKKLKSDNVPVDASNDAGFGSWYENNYTVPNGIIQKNELYYSNWWPIDSLPAFFYIYEFASEKQAKALYNLKWEYPIGKISNHLISFNEYQHFEIEEEGTKISVKPQNIHKIKLANVFTGFDSSSFPTHRDAENHLKQLLKRVFHLMMKDRGMFWYEMSNKQLAYYFTPSNLSGLKVKFEFPHRISRKIKSKKLIGKYKKLGTWHFAVSTKPILFPSLAFSLKSHIVFTNDGYKPWVKEDGNIDKDKIHSHRRAKGKRFFNEEWRDMVLAFLNGIKKDGVIEIALSNNFILTMSSMPELFWADFGYYEPKDNSRQGLLSIYDFEDAEQLEDFGQLEEEPLEIS